MCIKTLMVSTANECVGRCLFVDISCSNLYATIIFYTKVFKCMDLLYSIISSSCLEDALYAAKMIMRCKNTTYKSIYAGIQKHCVQIIYYMTLECVDPHLL